jgi:hypothetical protein
MPVDPRGRREPERSNLLVSARLRLAQRMATIAASACAQRAKTTSSGRRDERSGDVRGREDTRRPLPRAVRTRAGDPAGQRGDGRCDHRLISRTAAIESERLHLQRHVVV